MNTLHIISQSPYVSSELMTLIRTALKEEDAILMMGKGIYYGHMAILPQWNPLMLTCFALHSDMDQYGFKAHLSPHIIAIEMTQFVDLTCQYERSITWF